MRPATLAEVASATLQGDSFDRSLANFLDEFYSMPSAMRLSDEPPLLAECSENGSLEDAYLAATAEELARRFSLPVPGWVANEKRQLKRPWFASPLASLRAVLLQESPPAFRARNLFISENGLSRA
ncbi:hypothetical protein GC207_07150 [bacterium]|nr:hypothetical protein [bacterium]